MGLSAMAVVVSVVPLAFVMMNLSLMMPWTVRMSRMLAVSGSICTKLVPLLVLLLVKPGGPLDVLKRGM